MALADRGDRGSRRPSSQLPRRIRAGASAACSLAHLSAWEPLSESFCQAGTWDCFRCVRKPLMSPFWRSARSRSSRWRSSFLKGVSPYCFELLAQSRVESAYFVVARRGKDASAHSSSARRRAIFRRSQPLVLELLAQSRVESAYFVVARRGKGRLRSLLLSTAARDFPTLAALPLSD